MRVSIYILILLALNSCTSTTKTEITSNDDSEVDELGFEEVKIPNEEYAVYKLDSALQTEHLTYQYGDLWDLDNDGTMDSIAFIGNGGSHTYFHLQIKLSSVSDKWTVYPTFQIDMPYFDEIDSQEELEGLEESYTPFVVYDFDHDGIDEIYLNIENPFGSIPKELANKGLTSKHLIIDFKDDELRVMNFVL